MRVALLAEGVDRNYWDEKPEQKKVVALLAEGVDRNFVLEAATLQKGASPSSRRAWIEILWWPRSERCCFCRPPRGGRG